MNAVTLSNVMELQYCVKGFEGSVQAFELSADAFG